MIAHVDMDCFFCSCEVKRNPELIGPVIVGSTGSRGVVSAANYEARKFGVYSATPISIARKLCPNGNFLPVDNDYYKRQSAKVMQILSNFSDAMQQVSVDEAYLDISSLVNQLKDIKKAAFTIQETIKKETGLSCSVGVSKSKVVSKIASDFKKPGGITVVLDIPDFLAPLPIEKIPGIGKVSKMHYKSLGIETIKDLAGKNRFWVIENLGKTGVLFQDLARGIDKTVLSTCDAKSHSREHTLQNDTTDKNQLIEILTELCKNVHSDTRRSFRVVSIKIRYSDFTTITRDKTLTAHTRSFKILTKTAHDLFLSHYNNNSVRLIGVKVGELCSEIQTTLENFC